MRIKLGLHSTKEDNVWQLEKEFEGAGLGSPPRDIEREFMGALYEVNFDLEVDPETGEYVIVGISGDRFDERRLEVNGRTFWNMDKF